MLVPQDHLMAVGSSARAKQRLRISSLRKEREYTMLKSREVEQSVKGDHPPDSQPAGGFIGRKKEFYRWSPLLERSGLKPRRIMAETDAVYVDTSEGWFRIGRRSYPRTELAWLHNVLEYIEERGFRGWAVPWQRTVIWEEGGHCYLVQPWLKEGEGFHPDDPASLARIVEIMTEFYRCGKEYERNGLEICRDSFSSIPTEWEIARKQLAEIDNGHFPEKHRQEWHDILKKAQSRIADNLKNWEESGVGGLIGQQLSTGVIGHGNLLAKYIVGHDHDFSLLNWEYLAFQPRIKDLASLILDLKLWEPDWLLFLINETAKVQPFWPEEYGALFALLWHPQDLLNALKDSAPEGFNEDRYPKNLKEVAKEMARKEKCLTKAWRELGTEKRWAFRSPMADNPVPDGKVSWGLAPVESWGDTGGAPESLIRVKTPNYLPPEVLQSLSYGLPDRIVSGGDSVVLKAANTGTVQPISGGVPDLQPSQTVASETEIALSPVKPAAAVPVQMPQVVKDSVQQLQPNHSFPPHTERESSPTQILRWADFPKK